jgi:hypothetical protein
MDYQTQAKVGPYTIAAEFTGHAFPTEEAVLTAQDYVAVELAIYGPADSKLVITATDFSLRINRRKEPLPSQAWLLATRNVRDPEWIPEGTGAGGEVERRDIGGQRRPAGSGRAAAAGTEAAGGVVAELAAAGEEIGDCGRRAGVAAGGFAVLRLPGEDASRSGKWS